MRAASLARRSFAYYLPAHLATLLGVIVATAALTGALLVGDSLRGSLRSAAVDRLGRFELAVTSSRYFPESLSSRLAASPAWNDEFRSPAPVLMTSGALVAADSSRRVNNIQLFGVTELFWVNADEEVKGERVRELEPRTVTLNEALAAQLDVQVDDEVVLRVGRASAISADTLLGRREERSASIRLRVARIVPARDLGAFTLAPQQTIPLNAYLPLATLQRLMEQEGRVNALLIPSAKDMSGRASPELELSLQRRLRDASNARDAGLTVRPNRTREYLIVEHDSLLLPPALESAARATAEKLDLAAAPTLAYLANTIRVAGRSDAVEVPYSVVAALPATGRPLADFDIDVDQLKAGEIIVNAWTAEQLNAAVGDVLELDYFITGPRGVLTEQTTTFTLRAITPLAGAAFDPDFTPEYPGITDADRLTDWDPPFPINLRRIRPVDEEYWENFRATPKAFVTLEDGVRRWSEAPEVLGRYTALRVYPRPSPPPALASQPDVDPLDQLAQEFSKALTAALTPEEIGLTARNLRADFTAAGAGSTDFGGLFLGFSFFLLVSAGALIVLLFRLNIERRARQLGLLGALGLDRGALRGLLLREGAWIAVGGALLGVIAALGYAWLMLTGLRTIWAAAVQADFLTLHVKPLTLLIGFISGVLLALGAMLWAVRTLTRQPPRALLAGQLGDEARARRAGRWAPLAAGALTLVAITLVAAGVTGSMPQSGAFFGGGAALLVSGLLFFRIALRRPEAATPAHWNLRALALSNLRRNPGRSLLTAGLLASAAFLLTALEAFRLEPPDTSNRAGGAGGFPLIAETSVPLLADLNTADGRATLGVPEPDAAWYNDIHAYGFRLRPGDETSCLNLYRPQQPRILGAPADFIARGGFAFQASAAATQEARNNPWTLLAQPLPDGAIPVIGDEAAVRWQLHQKLGGDLKITDGAGRERTLRFVALLSGSVLQSELILSEDHFRALFPNEAGARVFLIETGALAANDALGQLEAALERYGFDATRTDARLRAFFAVQNTYLSTFQALGGFGLLLGACGLAAVVLRNLNERRRELALLQAVGYDRATLTGLLLRENVALVLIGVVLGVVPAVLAVLPALGQRPGAPSWLSLAGLLTLVIAVGVGAGALALRPLLRMRLIAALRSE